MTAPFLGIGPFHPDARLITGVEEDRETGGVRVYVGARWRNVYSLIVDPENCERARRLWAATYTGHLIASFQDLYPLHYEGELSRPRPDFDPQVDYPERFTDRYVI